MKITTIILATTFVFITSWPTESHTATKSVNKKTVAKSNAIKTKNAKKGAHTNARTKYCLITPLGKDAIVALASLKFVTNTQPFPNEKNEPLEVLAKTNIQAAR